MPPAAAASQHSTSPQMARGVIATIGSRFGGLSALRMSRFRGVQVDLVNVPNFCVKRASNLYVSSAESAQARNSKSESVLEGAYGEPSEVPRKLRADRAQGRRVGFLGKEKKKPTDLKPPLLDLSIALLFFKARVRQQMLQPPAIGPWRRPLETVSHLTSHMLMLSD